MDRGRSPAVNVGVVGTKSCDLELKSVLDYDDNAKFRPYRISPPKNLLNRFGGCIGGDVEIVCGLSAEHVADTAAGKIGNVFRFAETPGNFTSGLFQLGVRILFFVGH